MDNNEPWVFLPELEPVPQSPPDTVREVISWWERRRLIYNLTILALFVLGAVVVAMLRARYVARTGILAEWSLFYLFGAMHLVFILVVANACYTCGWVLHLLVRAITGSRVSHFGPVVYGIGVVFSIIIMCTLFATAAIPLISEGPPSLISCALTTHQL